MRNIIPVCEFVEADLAQKEQKFQAKRTALNEKFEAEKKEQVAAFELAEKKLIRSINVKLCLLGLIFLFLTVLFSSEMISQLLPIKHPFPQFKGWERPLLLILVPFSLYIGYKIYLYNTKEEEALRPLREKYKAKLETLSWQRERPSGDYLAELKRKLEEAGFDADEIKAFFTHMLVFHPYQDVFSHKMCRERVREMLETAKTRIEKEDSKAKQQQLLQTLFP